MTPLPGVILGGMARLFVARDMAAYQIHPSQTRCDAGPMGAATGRAFIPANVYNFSICKHSMYPFTCSFQ